LRAACDKPAVAFVRTRSDNAECLFSAAHNTTEPSVGDR